MGEAAKKQDEQPSANSNAATPPSPWLTTREAAARLKMTREGIKSLVFRGKIKPDHRGGRGGLRGHRFLAETLDAYVKNKGQE